jgi:hypothetical protein
VVISELERNNLLNILLKEFDIDPIIDYRMKGG